MKVGGGLVVACSPGGGVGTPGHTTVTPNNDHHVKQLALTREEAEVRHTQVHLARWPVCRYTCTYNMYCTCTYNAQVTRWLQLSYCDGEYVILCIYIPHTLTCA